MDKSLAFVIDTSRDSHRVTNVVNGLSEASVLDLKTCISTCFGVDSIVKMKSVTAEVGNRLVEIIFDDTVQFDYFTSNTVTHDGTLYFTRDAVDKAIKRLVNGETYYKEHELMSDFVCNPEKYKFIYTVGNVILHSDFGLKDINGVTMMGQIDSVFIPVKFEVEERSIVT
jgi:hypothetical protein